MQGPTSSVGILSVWRRLLGRHGTRGAGECTERNESLDGTLPPVKLTLRLLGQTSVPGNTPRLYRPRKEVLDGTWKCPEPVAVS